MEDPQHSKSNHSCRAAAVDIYMESRSDAKKLRLKKLLDEAPLSAFMERPNLISSSSLREVAQSLAGYVKPEPKAIDLRDCRLDLSKVAGVDERDVDRVFSYYERQIRNSSNEGKNKSHTTIDSLLPFVKVFRRCFSSSSDIIKSVLKLPIINAYIGGDAAEKKWEDISMSENSVSRLSTSDIESLIFEAVKNGTVEAFLVAALAILISCAKGVNLASDNCFCWESGRTLRVGGLLALLPTGDSVDDKSLTSSREQQIEIDDKNNDTCIKLLNEVIRFEIFREHKESEDEANTLMTPVPASPKPEDEESFANDANFAIEGVDGIISPDRNLAEDLRSPRIDVDPLEVMNPNNSVSDDVEDDDEDDNDDEDESVESGESFDDFYHGYNEEDMLRQALAMSLSSKELTGNGDNDVEDSKSDVSSTPSQNIEDKNIYAPLAGDVSPIISEEVERDYLPENKSTSVTNFDARETEIFGAVPAQFVLLHILKAVHFLLETSRDNQKDPQSDILQSFCPGGVGSSLFPVKTRAISDNKIRNEPPLVFHLLMTVFIVLSESRFFALGTLPLQRTVAIIESDDTDSVVDPADVSGVKEGEDSRTTFASKGLHRKAAAAADAAALRKKEDAKRSFIKESDVQFLSNSTLIVLKSVCLIRGNGATQYRTHIEGSTLEKNVLATAFERIHDPSHSKDFKEILLKMPSLSLDLCSTSVQVWSDLLGLFYAQPFDRQILLDSLLTRHHSRHSTPSKGNISIPWSTSDVDEMILFHLCNRFCEIDTIDSLICDSNESDQCQGSPHFLSLLVVLEKVVLSESLPISCDLFCALIHRANNIFILNGEGIDLVNQSLTEKKDVGAGKLAFGDNALMFDPSYCCDSVAIKSSVEGFRSSSVLQRASKVWGTVLSDTSYSPKSGIHRFAVRLDHCEKGHVFVGIATSQATTKSYVGSDGNGWGLIGTQALWHNRSKIRNDYGSPFRTGDVIVVSLNTNNGSISFGVLKDDSEKNNSISSKSIKSFDDWGVAFEGLPMDTKFYPAVGLYQRDDKVTLLSLVGPSSDISTEFGKGFAERSRNNFVTDYALYIMAMMDNMVDRASSRSLTSCNSRQHLDLFCRLAPAFSASISLVGDQANNFASLVVTLLPIFGTFIKKIDKLEYDKLGVDCHGIAGEWLVRAMSPDGSKGEGEIYSLNIRVDHKQSSKGCLVFSGDGKGEKGGSNGGKVTVLGSLQGLRLRFVEIWQKGDDSSIESSCVIDSRLSMNSRAFEGVYTPKNGPSRPIAGLMKKPYDPNETWTVRNCQMISSLAFSHLVAMTIGDRLENSWCSSDSHLSPAATVEKWVGHDLLSNGLLDDNVDTELQELRRSYSREEVPYRSKKVEFGRIFSDFWKLSSRHYYPSSENFDHVPSLNPDIDEWVHLGDGTFSLLADKRELNVIKLQVVSTILYHSSGYDKVLKEFSSNMKPSDLTKSFWRCALNIVDNCIRRHISKNGVKHGLVAGKFSNLVMVQSDVSMFHQVLTDIDILAFKLLRLTSGFLQNVQRNASMEVEVIIESVRKFYNTFTSPNEIELLKRLMKERFHKIMISALGMTSIRLVLSKNIKVGAFAGAIHSECILDSCLSMIPLIFRDTKFIQCNNGGLTLAHKHWRLERCSLYSLLFSISRKFILKEELDNDVLSLLFTLQACFSGPIDTYLCRGVLGEKMFKANKKWMLDLISYFADPKIDATVNTSILTSYFTKRHLMNAMWSAFSTMLIQISQKMSQIGDEVFAAYETGFTLLTESIDRSAETVGLVQKEERCDYSSEIAYNEVKKFCRELQCLQNGTSVKEKDRPPTHEDNMEVKIFCEGLCKNASKSILLGSLDLKNSSFENPSEKFFMRVLGLVDALTSNIEESPPIAFSKEACKILLSLLHAPCGEERSHFVLPTNVMRKMLRVLRRLLSFCEADESVVQTLFQYCSFDCRNSDNNFEGVLSSHYREEVAIEIVSILRHLILNSEKWKHTIYEVSFRLIKSNSNEKVRSVLALFGGSPMRLTLGGHVIVDSERIKTKSGIERVEEINRTISRRSCAAGVLSNIDSRSNLCEIILFDNRKLSSQKFSMTQSSADFGVRAVKSSFDEISPVTELPLVLDKDVSSLQEVLVQLLNKHDEDANVDVYSTQMMVLRTLSLLLSKKENVEACLSSGYLHKVLQLASNDEGDDEHLSNIGLREHRYLLQVTNSKTLRCLENFVGDYELSKKALQTMMESSELCSSDVNHESNNDDDSESTAETNNDQNRPSEDEMQAAIAQMAELGIPRAVAELALRRTPNVETAVHYCLEYGQMEQLIAESRAREATRGRRNAADTGHLLAQLQEMGFPQRWCAEALAATSNNVDEALTWILSNSDRLQEQDEEEKDNNEEDDDLDDVEEDNNEEEEQSLNESNDEDEGSLISSHAGEFSESKSDQSIDSDTGLHSLLPCSIQTINGKPTVNPRTLEVAGSPDSGFSSIGTRGILHTSGKWYYEVELLSAGCLQIGWADGSFAGHCQATDRRDGYGVGDGPSSWAYDGWRKYRWHTSATEWGCRWTEGDVVGCCVDMDERVVSFTLNGKSEEIGMGVAFSGDGFRPCGGVFACVSFNHREQLKFIFGDKFPNSRPFKFGPPLGYRGVDEAIQESRTEMNLFMKYEDIYSTGQNSSMLNSSPMCDLSDGEHGHELFAWQHRYFGCDASVHLSAGKSKEKEKIQKHKSDEDVTEIVSQIWKDYLSEENLDANEDNVLGHMKKSYQEAKELIQRLILMECRCLLRLYAKKLVLQVMVMSGHHFNLDIFSDIKSNPDPIRAANEFWVVVEACCSLQASGWVGEAGAMAIAAEALGLGISSSEGSKSILPTRNSATNLMPAWLHPSEEYSSQVLASASEVAFWGKHGIALIFLRDSLQTTFAKSEMLRKVVIAFIRKSVRLLANVEIKDTSEDGKKEVLKSSSSEDIADSRLILFLTGALTCTRVQEHLPIERWKSIVGDLLESWSIGLLSGSAPWRMISAFITSGLVNLCTSKMFDERLSQYPTIKNYFRRLPSTTVRRIWAERAAIPISSRYLQSMLELITSLENIGWAGFENVAVDAATPIPKFNDYHANWESDEGWISSDTGWVIWLGSVEYLSVEWVSPTISTVRALMDEGRGPPMLQKGDVVCRGVDWDHDDEDGRKGYEEEKSAFRKENEDNKTSESTNISEPSTPQNENTLLKPEKRKKKSPHPQLPLGTVVSVEEWEGVPCVGRRIRWNRTGVEKVYRYGGDGGKFDICHVEINNKKSRKIRKRYPLPETTEQIMSRHGFGKRKKYNVILRIRCRGERIASGSGSDDLIHRGILEWPDFGASVSVKCTFHADGAMSIIEERLLHGCKDSGWEARFGQPDFVPGTTMILSPMEEDGDGSSSFKQLLGSYCHIAKNLRNKADGKRVRVTSEMRLWQSKKTHHPPTKDNELLLRNDYIPQPLAFDKEFHAPSISISKNGLTATCVSSDGRCAAFGAQGFTKGVHYWEVKIEQGDAGSIYIGVAEKPTSGSLNDVRKGWPGWGFVNFRATYTASIERVYGSHTNTGDVVGVLLDCDCGRISFFYDGLKYGEHILNDLGVAFSNISPFGFNADGCGGGGAGQGAPSGLEGGSRVSRCPANGNNRPRALWPIIGFKTKEDRAAFTGKWISNYGVDSSDVLRNVMRIDQTLCCYVSEKKLPAWLTQEAYNEYKKWMKCSSISVETRGCAPIPYSTFSLKAELDISPLSCAKACASLGMSRVLLSGDRVEVKRSQGRILELPEIAEVMGTLNGRLFYRLVSQKSEGGSLVEGGGRPWFWDESEVVDGSLVPLKADKYPALPLLERFACEGYNLRIVYEKGALIRSDIEIDSSESLGTIPNGHVITCQDIFDCRRNSSGILRYNIVFNDMKGWISSTIRGGRENPIVEHIAVIDEILADGDSVEVEAITRRGPIVCPEEAAQIWYKNFTEDGFKHEMMNFDQFDKMLKSGVIDGLSALESDSKIVSFMNLVNKISPEVQITEMTSALESLNTQLSTGMDGRKGLIESAAVSFANVRRLPSPQSLISRVCLLKALNKRVKYALPWLPLKPTQEGNAIFGGVNGFGASLNRVGRSHEIEDQRWVKIDSLGNRIRKCRRLIFSIVKNEFFAGIIGTTTTPTPISPDEYELPREIRTVHVNRIKARKANNMKKFSIFSQLKYEMRGWNGAWLRRSFIAKGHGGQKRAFKVKLVGEGVNDYSGPYREIFTDAIREVSELGNGIGILNLLNASPNRQFDLGENRDLLVFPLSKENDATEKFNPDLLRSVHDFFQNIGEGINESTREVENGLAFLGRLIATACRHGIKVDLPLPMNIVWRKIAEDCEQLSEAELLAEVDLLESRSFSNGDKKRGKLFLQNQQRMLNAFAEGMSSVLPLELFHLFTGSELRELICGNSDVDVELLKRVVEYEGYTSNSPMISYLWEILNEMTSNERKLFLQFVWARTCLPSNEADFDVPFKIIKDVRSGAEGEGSLPSASTCFFSLTLPEYGSKEILKEKLMFAIQNGYTMEMDFATNNTEIDKGWRE